MTEIDRSLRKENRFLSTLKIMCRNPGAVVGAVIIVLIAIACIVVPLVSPYSYSDINPLEVLQQPSAAHPFGTDRYGRDMLVRVAYGARYTLSIGVFSTLISLVLGTLIGAVAGFFGGKVDNIIMRFLDIFMALPQTLLAIVIAAMIGTGIKGAVIAVTVATIPRYAQAVRGPILAIRNQEFVEAAVALDAKDSRIILKHILPNVLSPIIVQVTMGVGSAITMAASLSFLGLGIQPPHPEWGALLSASRNYILDHSYLVTFPGVAIALVVLSLNLMGDGLRDAMDPRWKD